MRASDMTGPKPDLKRDPFLECRPGASGHAWDIINEPVDAPQPRLRKGDPIFRRCLRCTTLRVDHVNALRKVAYRRYVHPVGYSRRGLTPADVRAESLRRVKRFKTDSELYWSILNKERD